MGEDKVGGVSQSDDRFSARTSNALDAADGTGVLRLLRAALQEGVFLDSLDDDVRHEVPAETLDRYAAAFRTLTGRAFDPRRVSITWDEVADEG